MEKKSFMDDFKRELESYTDGQAPWLMTRKKRLRVRKQILRNLRKDYPVIVQCINERIEELHHLMKGQKFGEKKISAKPRTDRTAYGATFLQSISALFGKRGQGRRTKVKKFEKNTMTAYENLVKKFDLLPCDDIISTITGNTTEAVRCARNKISKLGYKFEKQLRKDILANGGRSVYEWKIVERPKPVIKEIKPISVSAGQPLSKGQINQIVEAVVQKLSETGVNLNQ